jgi:aryl-alcohol dehydrogenase-like predicted oxidoreductase
VAGAGNRNVQDGIDIGPQKIRRSVEDSLGRLQTDYLDLYQLHWPNRGSYHFRRNWSYDPTAQAKGERDDMRAILETLAALIAEGKVAHVGLSNETAWGTSAFLELATHEGLPRMLSIQNEYNLLCRLFDTDLAELCHHEDVGLLAYSPLAAGLLTDKYREGRRPNGSRATINQNLAGRLSPRSERVASEYADLARKHGLDPAQMALAFCAARPFMASVIVGATDVRQLETDLGAADLDLPGEVMDGIARLHREHPLPI